MEDFGVSYERRRLVLLKIVNFGRIIKPLIFIEAGIHAREWVAPAQALFIIHQLLEVPDNKELIEKVDWIVIPLVNPDGYEYSHSVDRMWRKNRAKGKTCDGVDLNRNFDFHWSQHGSSDYECSSTYAGVSAFSEPESLALSAVIKRYASRTKLYLSIHTAEQCILFPWGYTMEVAENDLELRQLASLVARKVYNISKVEYKVGTSAQTLNIVSGSSRDWAYGVCNISLAFTIELEAHLNTRHCDRFIMPPRKINKVVSEMFEGIKVFYTFIKDKYSVH
ncbi:hypothetical protein RI129_008170 [Pyrocoelia pectoralis]|uniref:Peptidase M14 domain-containing protein n=1 Tax=Pyrocoelia pectoralis TaxID=417401 RepID=A0AAN7VAQ4_9COLE